MSALKVLIVAAGLLLTLPVEAGQRSWDDGRHRGDRQRARVVDVIPFHRTVLVPVHQRVCAGGNHWRDDRRHHGSHGFGTHNFGDDRRRHGDWQRHREWRRHDDWRRPGFHSFQLQPRDCRTVVLHHKRRAVVGYKVVYLHHGRRHVTFSDHHPGHWIHVPR